VKNLDPVGTDSDVALVLFSSWRRHFRVHGLCTPRRGTCLFQW
jgi:hypothetical protein